MANWERWQELGLLSSARDADDRLLVELPKIYIDEVLHAGSEFPDESSDAIVALVTEEGRVELGRLRAPAVALMQRIVVNKDLVPTLPLTAEALLSVVERTCLNILRLDNPFPPSDPQERCYRCAWDRDHLFPEKYLSDQPTRPIYFCPLHNRTRRPRLRSAPCT